METGVSVTRIDPDAGERLISLRRALGVTSFGLTQLTLQPGERGRIHRHERQEEVFLVLSGVLSLVVEGEERDIASGELVRVGPEVRRRLQNRGPETCLILGLGAAGEHAGRDAIAYRSWDDPSPGPPQEVPIPEDLPASELRSAD